jgi:hypothetical protein
MKDTRKCEAQERLEECTAVSLRCLAEQSCSGRALLELCRTQNGGVVAIGQMFLALGFRPITGETLELGTWNFTGRKSIEIAA